MADASKALRDLEEAAAELEQRAISTTRTRAEREEDLRKAERLRQIMDEIRALDLDY
jgi:hypothetical protein